MSNVAIRKHAILKHHYRHVVKATPQFNELDSAAQWAALRQHVEADATPLGATLLKVMDNRHERREEVLAALEKHHREDFLAGDAAAKRQSAGTRPA